MKSRSPAKPGAKAEEHRMTSTARADPFLRRVTRRNLPTAVFFGPMGSS